MAAKFGTSGLRGLVEELLGETTIRHVKAFARHMLASKAIATGDTVYVGWDFRGSSPAIASDVAFALADEGLSCANCGAVPSPALASYAMERKSASIMVTGSHIPADRNGIKFFRPDGEISKEDEAGITALAQEIRTAHNTNRSLMEDFPSLRQKVDMAFIQRLQPLLERNPLSGKTFGVYQHSTVARDLLVTVLRRAGANVVELERSEHFIPVDTEAVSADTLSKLHDWAAESKFDAIVSADGDGDRPLVADETGTVLRGDLIGLLTAKFVEAKIVVTPVTSNSGLEAALAAKVIRTRVGSPYVISAMQEALMHQQGPVVGFEANGGFLTMSTIGLRGSKLPALPTRDSFLPILAVLLTAASSNRSLAELAKDCHLPSAAAGLIKEFPQDRAAALLQHLQSAPNNLVSFLNEVGSVAHIDNTDGLRVTLDRGRIAHLRTSGNAPEFRCYVEAAEDNEAQRLLAQLLRLVGGFADGK